MKIQYAYLIIYILALTMLSLSIFSKKRGLNIDRLVITDSLETSTYSKIENEPNFAKYVIVAGTQEIGLLSHLENQGHKSNRSSYSLLNMLGDSIDKLNKPYTFDIPKAGEIKYFKNSQPYYYYRFGLYTQENGIDSLINPTGVSVYDAFPLENGNILCLGEIKSNNDKFNICFFEINSKSRVINVLYSIQENAISTKAEDLLIYAGQFFSIKNETAFVYERRGTVLFFNSFNGRFINSLNTIDNNPFPKVIKYGNSNTYKRNESNLSNAGVLIKNSSEQIVFSSNPIIQNRLLLDRYSNGEYKRSLQLWLENLNALDIRFIKQTGFKIYLGTKRNLYIINTKFLLKN